MSKQLMSPMTGGSGGGGSGGPGGGGGGDTGGGGSGDTGGGGGGGDGGGGGGGDPFAPLINSTHSAGMPERRELLRWGSSHTLSFMMS